MADATDKDLAGDLKSLVDYAADARGNPLPTPKVKEPLPAVKSVATPSGSASAAVGEESADWIETAVADRTYWAGKFYRSTDGLLVFSAVRKMTFADNNDAPRSLELADPEP